MTEAEKKKDGLATQDTRKKLLETIKQLIESDSQTALGKVLADARSSDIAEVMEVLAEESRVVLLDLLDPKDAGEVLEKLDEATRGEVIEDLSAQELTDIVATLPPDEAADVLSELPEEQSEEILDHISKIDSDRIERLMRYDEDTAGGIMTPVVIKISTDATIEHALAEIRIADPDEDFFYVFVVDAGGVLKGTVSIRNLLRGLPNTLMSEVMDQELPKIHVQTDQEKVANNFRKNDLLAVPVVDANGVLLGRITVDDIVDVMEEEAQEDVMVMAGTHPAELDTHGAFRAARVRLPWLLACMGSAMVSCGVLVEYFQPRLAGAFKAVMMFYPAIVAMGGNSGMQTSTVVVRGLATGDLAASKISQVFMRESRVAIIVACVCALIAGLVSGIWLSFDPGDLGSDKVYVFGLSVGLAMFGGIMLSTTLGMVLPFLFRRLGIDPAISSGPLVTTANDALGCLMYFCLVLLLLRHLTL